MSVRNYAIISDEDDLTKMEVYAIRAYRHNTKHIDGNILKSKTTDKFKYFYMVK